MPPLAAVGAFIRTLEAEHGIAFRRERAYIRTNLAGAKRLLSAWLCSL